MQFEINEATVKQLAWAVKNSLGEKGHEVPSTALLEALSKGFGFECYRAIKGVAAVAEPSKFRALAHELMKGDSQIPVYVDVTYSEGERKKQGRPTWAKLVVTQEVLVRILALETEVAKGDVHLTLNELHMTWEEWAHAEHPQELHVGRWGFWMTMHMGIFGRADTRVMDFEGMRTLLLERKAGQPVFVEIVDKEYVLATDPDNGKQQPRYLIAECWGHCFVGSHNTDVNFVYDYQLGRVTHMTLSRALGDEPAHRDEMADVTDSLKNANEDALDNPEDWGLEVSNELPDWALKLDGRN